jgi:fatty-acyl-CoA synthase
LKQGSRATADEFREHLAGRVAKWWLPDQIIFVDELPLGATGKIDKKKLRENLALFLANPDFPSGGSLAARPPVVMSRPALFPF